MSRKYFVYQSIVTKYLGPTNFRGSRIKATCSRGSLTISKPDNLNEDDAHKFAVEQLVEKFVCEDENGTATKRGTPRNENSWKRDFVTGCLPNGDYCHVFID